MKMASIMCLLFMIIMFFVYGIGESKKDSSTGLEFAVLFFIIIELIPLMYILYGG